MMRIIKRCGGIVPKARASSTTEMVKDLKANMFPPRDHSEVPLRDEVHYLAVNEDGKQVRVV